jgi:hypothetical protein
VAVAWLRATAVRSEDRDPYLLWVPGRVKSMRHVKPDSVAPYLADYQATGFDSIKPYEEPASVFDSLVAVGRRLAMEGRCRSC